MPTGNAVGLNAALVLEVWRSGGLEAASSLRGTALCSALAMCHNLTASNILHLLSTLTQLEQIMFDYNFLLKYIYVQQHVHDIYI